jgi:hypothetical protein
MAVFKIDDIFTSSVSDEYDNDSDFIQHIVLGGHTSYASLFSVADSDGISSWAALKDSCASILQSSTYFNFNNADQSIERSTNWPADSANLEEWDMSRVANDSTYYEMYRAEIPKLNISGSFRTTPYVRKTIRIGDQSDSDGNNWGK